MITMTPNDAGYYAEAYLLKIRPSDTPQWTVWHMEHVLTGSSLEMRFHEAAIPNGFALVVAYQTVLTQLQNAVIRQLEKAK